MDDFWCDRDVDCSDQSDEESCDYPLIECAKDQYFCPSLKSVLNISHAIEVLFENVFVSLCETSGCNTFLSCSMCHNDAWICDGENDCRNLKKHNIYDDEANCSSIKTVSFVS